jgi:hypothetical protein
MSAQCGRRDIAPGFLELADPIVGLTLPTQGFPIQGEADPPGMRPPDIKTEEEK